MALQFRNSLTKKLEEFKPIESGKAKIYTCGPTVYNYLHIGNFKTFMWGDLLKRYLKYQNYEVTHVMNLTDIDDKIIRDSQKTGKSLSEFTRVYIDSFFEDYDTLGLERADFYPKATEHIDGMVQMVQKLVENGLAYEVDGSYYYKIEAFKDYGQLANIDRDNLKPGERVSSDEYEKESISDFALWKAWEETDGDIFWETEIGKGRPGWHLECSVMSMKYLGETFDIHTGGIDLLFPHHENEIAQSEGATGKKFVNCWMHGEHLIVEGKKMSKSLGNYYTVKDILDKGYSGVVIRYLLISSHYRHQFNFTFKGLDAARESLSRYTDFFSNLESYKGGNNSGGKVADAMATAKMKFEDSLDDDLNISGALAAIFDFIKTINRLKDEDNFDFAEKIDILELMNSFDTVLNFRFSSEGIDEEIEKLIAQRTEAKANKDFTVSDKIRDDLLAQGIILEDTRDGVKWKRKI